MLSKEEIKKWLLENCVDEYGNINLNCLDFSDFNGSVKIGYMKVKGSLFQNCQNVEGNLIQDYQTVGGDLYQERQKVKGSISDNQDNLDSTENKEDKVALPHVEPFPEIMPTNDVEWYKSTIDRLLKILETWLEE